MSIQPDQAAPVRRGEELPVAELQAYLHEHLGKGSLTVEQFPSGYSNLTYLLRLGEHEYVLRRPPFGNVVKSAHDMGREYRVLSGLCGLYPPAPRPFLHCEDESVIGASFYVMERRRGVIIRKQAPAQIADNPENARKLGESFIDNLAALHSLDYQAAGLGGLGRPEGYVQRQITGWVKRYHRAKTAELSGMEAATAWLSENIPAPTGAALVHNDYKYDNLILDPDDLTRIVAVLDWEMTTLGDPVMDLGASLGYWVEASDPPALKAASFAPTHLPGSLTRREIVGRYTERTGAAIGDGFVFYYAYGLFRVGVIVQQIYARYVHGKTKDPRFARLQPVVEAMGGAAEQAIELGRY